MPNFKSISFKMAVLQGGEQNLPSPCVCYPKDPMWNRVKMKELLMYHCGCHGNLATIAMRYVPNAYRPKEPSYQIWT